MNDWSRSYSYARFLRHVRNERPAVKIAGIVCAAAYGLLIGYCLYMGVLQ